ncbi:UDP-N-acetylglucosamine:LPS N-acetylglucosamine transferase [Fictibacillus solisalsi]|uniref:UDP-N-acetylglucosamine:LPS N-acetylglucosamine transferase n=1 Tax=Fictibacillus solisalsi TaxID=459525 RepID=A0A1G9TIY3_9BACL|nr:galactosyldiacylglycerol synthase [Fictibacillus solisalsi]SDM47707.1 UDP-N-acetylglucosamine:LPS N-acetylglucosamine transferase [Fictibacillus solisalsi]
MRKILFLPFLQMPSGHHQAAEALIDMLKIRKKDIVLKKVDLLSYMNVSLEKMVTRTYLKWIKNWPGTYDRVYKNLTYSAIGRDSFKGYDLLFSKKMLKLLDDEQPDVIICTHSIPSYLVNELKRKGKCHVPVMNVYTDFFINDVWGKEEIDYHFVPNQDMKTKLMVEHHVPHEKIIVSGIPVHEQFKRKAINLPTNTRRKVLISGGSSGLGDIYELITAAGSSGAFDYYVLCGKNRKLYEKIRSLGSANIHPLPYISSRSEMNEWYDRVDAVVTKPGGITVSEALRKNLPIFVHSVLPGQEEINLEYLEKKNLVFRIDKSLPLESQLKRVLRNQPAMKNWQAAKNAYEKGLEMLSPDQMTKFIQSLLEPALTLSRQA